MKANQARRRNRARTTIVDDDEDEYNLGVDGAADYDDGMAMA